MRRWMSVVALLAVMLSPAAPRALAQSGSGSVTIGPAQTAGVISEDPGDGTPPYGATYLPFGNYISTSIGGPVFARSYLLFLLDAIPADVTVTSARLEVDVDLFSFPGSGTFGAYSVTAAWDESMTWATRAPADPTPSVATMVASVPGTYTWDVTNLVNAWLSGTPNNGMMLAAIPPIDSGSLPDQGFAARGQGRTSASPPRLIVEWGAPRLKSGTIRGTVFLDADSDGVFDADEAGLAGIPVQVETDGGWKVDLVTGDNGMYAPAGLKPAWYRVRISVPPGYAPTTPTERGPFELHGNAVLGQDFGLASAPVTLPTTGDPGWPSLANALLLTSVGGAILLMKMTLVDRRGRRRGA